MVLQCFGARAVHLWKYLIAVNDTSSELALLLVMLQVCVLQFLMFSSRLFLVDEDVQIGFVLLSESKHFSVI